MNWGRIACLSFLLGVTALRPVLAASVGQRAPDFTLSDSRKTPRSLSQYKGKVVLLNFWASWCAPCQVELPKLNALAARHKGKLQVVAISVDTDKSQGLKALSKLGLSRSNLEVLWDTQGKAASAYDPPTMPSSYILDASGKIRFMHDGYRPTDPDLWEQEVQTLLH